MNQAAERHRLPLGPGSDRIDQHPHVLSGSAVDARRIPTFLPSCPTARQNRAARGERTPLHHVS